MHRSGTSLVASILNELGIYCGEPHELLPPAPDNISGFFERKDVKELNDQLLRENGFSWASLANFSQSELNYESIESFKKQAFQIITALDKNEAWFIKDPRCCLLVPQWIGLLQKPKILFVYRHPKSIANSLKLRNNFPVSIGFALWEKYMTCLFSSLNHHITFIDFQKLISGNIVELKKLIGDLKIQITDIKLKELSERIKPHLVHEGDHNQKNITLFQQQLIELIENRDVKKIKDFIGEHSSTKDDEILKLHSERLDSMSMNRELMKIEKNLREQNNGLTELLNERNSKINEISNLLSKYEGRNERNIEFNDILITLNEVLDNISENQTRNASINENLIQLANQQSEISDTIKLFEPRVNDILEMQTSMQNQISEIKVLKKTLEGFSNRFDLSQQLQKAVNLSIDHLHNQLNQIVTINTELVKLTETLQTKLLRSKQEKDQAIAKLNHERETIRNSISFQIGWIITRPVGIFWDLFKR